jgi:hypothetical protein
VLAWTWKTERRRGGGLVAYDGPEIADDEDPAPWTSSDVDAFEQEIRSAAASPSDSQSQFEGREISVLIGI